MLRRIRTAALAAAALALGGCVVGDGEADKAAVADTAAVAAQPAPAPTTAQPQQPMPAPQPAQPAAPASDLRLEVNVAQRKVYAFKGDQEVAAYPIAVGTEEWPTRTGEWTIGQVIWNPEWVPPAEEWAKDEEKKEAGDPDNPLGRVQLVYDAPRSIHGTNEPQSLGKAASHGSIRISNANGRRLARMVMEAGGANRDEAFFTQVWENRKERVEVPIPNPVPIRVVSGGDRESSYRPGESPRGGGAGSEKGAEKGSTKGN